MLPDLEKYYGTGENFPRIVFSGIKPGDELKLQIQKHLGSSFEFGLHDTGMQCSASLSNGMDGFLANRSASHRRSLKKQSSRATKNGISFERVRPTSKDQSNSVYQRMLTIELASWKGIEQCGMTESPAKEYYDVMLRRLSESKAARIIFARHEDNDIGYIFGGLVDGLYRGQQFSYDNEWSSSSIGNLMQIEKVKWLCEEDVQRYDLGPMMDYKKHWTELEFPFETWVAFRKN
jgi:CelD/BcsL family acetyltransferase involved in cellulose biosynthesis